MQSGGDERRRLAASTTSSFRRLTGAETVLGSRYGDTLIGDGGPNHLAGLNGNHPSIAFLAHRLCASTGRTSNRERTNAAGTR